MEVHFYLPERYLPDSDRQEAWRSGKITRLEEGGKIACAQCWIFQTWLALERSGFPAHLTHSMPSDGVLVTLTSCVESDFRASGSRFLCRDRGGLSRSPSRATARRPKRGSREAIVERCFHSALAASQPDSARSGALRTGLKTSVSLAIARILRGKWPTSGGRGSSRTNWASTLLSAARIAGTIIARPTAWLPCAGSDALRIFTSPQQNFTMRGWREFPLLEGWIPPTQRMENQGGIFCGRRHLTSFLAHIRQLKEEPALRDRLVAAGSIAARNFTSEAILGRWKNFLGDTVQGLAERWQRKGPAARRIFFSVQTASVWLDTRLRR